MHNLDGFRCNQRGPFKRKAEGEEQTEGRGRGHKPSNSSGPYKLLTCQGSVSPLGPP